MNTKKIYMALSFLAIFTLLLLPSKSTFAKAETSTQERGNKDEMRTGTIKGNEGEAEAHRSTVASFVKNLLEVADRNKTGIGEQVRVVAIEENEAKDKVAEAVKTVDSRNWLKTFLVGADYKNIGMIRSEMVKTQSRIDQLSRLLKTMSTSTGSVTTSEQINLLTQEQTKLENFLKTNESKFSLFGWFAKLFNR